MSYHSCYADVSIAPPPGKILWHRVPQIIMAATLNGCHVERIISCPTNLRMMPPISFPYDLPELWDRGDGGDGWWHRLSPHCRWAQPTPPRIAGSTTGAANGGSCSCSARSRAVERGRRQQPIQMDSSSHDLLDDDELQDSRTWKLQSRWWDEWRRSSDGFKGD
jgi:hypothetical protein